MPRGGGEATGGSGRSSRGGRGPVSREVGLSKKLSWLLRHGAEKEGLLLGKGGFANLQDVLENRNIKSFGRPTLPEIRTIVADNDKQRYTLIHISASPESAPQASAFSVPTPEQIVQDANPARYLIRANQGHSLKVDQKGLLTPITLEAGNLPAVVVHGTTRAAWAKILASGGLKPMGRNHVHFATGVPESLATKAAKEIVAEDHEVRVLEEEKETPKVLSGMRNSSTVLVFVDLKGALEKGLKFSMSANGVVLSEGDEKGLVGVEFFERVEERGGKLLVKYGQFVGETSASYSTMVTKS